MIVIDGNSLKIEDIYKVSNDQAKVELSNDKNFLDKIKKSRSFLEEYIQKGYPIYGVTTGFGDSCHNQINHLKSEKLQLSLARFHGIGVGNYFTEKEGKAILLVRLNSNCKGYSAIRLEVLNLLKEILNRGIIPLIPEIGSVGASGDLTPLSYVASLLMGEKSTVYYKGEIVDAEVAFKKEKITPIKFMAKESLAIMNGTSVMTAISALAWTEINKLCDLADFITASTIEIIGGNELPYREKIHQLKNHKGQIESANTIYKILKDSKRAYNYEELLAKIGTIEDNGYKKHDIKIQERYSVRCAPHIIGVLRDTLSFSKIWIENEINSSNDNPLVDSDNEVIYNSGNFYGGHICAVCDYLRIALANISDLADKQAELIIDGKFNKLTENLIPVIKHDSEDLGLFHGFKAAQITISAICSEIQFLAGPVSIHSRPTESLNQDKVSLGTISARRLREMIDMLYYQYSIHLLAIFQAVDIIGIDLFSEPIQILYKKVRKFTSFVDKDRPIDNEARMLKEYLVNNTIDNIINY